MPSATKEQAGMTTGGKVHAVENAEVARIFRELADLLELQDANPFRIRAYRNAARLIEELAESVDAVSQQNPDHLSELPGIGKDLAFKICEICRTGTLRALKEAQHAAPQGALELMRVPGLGPKRAKKLCDELKVRSLQDLAKAAKRGHIRKVRGFGKTSERKILVELEARGPEEHRVLRSVAAQYGEGLLAYLRALPAVQRAEIAGSYRRCKETVADLDVLVGCTTGAAVVDQFVKYPEAEEVLAQGPTKASIRLRSGLQVDLRVLPPESYGSALHYLTGSKPHNIAIRRLGQDRGLKINEYGVFRSKRSIGGAEEADVFKAVGLPWIPPELREQRGEIEAAREGRLPRLIELKEIRGDLHVHTIDSDGRDSVETMVRAAEEMGYEYLAITDHSPALRMVRGLDAAGFRRQMARIDRLNSRMKRLTILKGAEVDIHPDGTLDLPDSILDALDIVLVSVHSRFELGREEQTQRLVRALQHKSVDVLAHPTGRIIGKRRAIAWDFNQVCRAASDHGIVLEINAQPERLDLDDVSARAAVGRGIRLEISTDSHSTAELRFMRWGVDQARRGWVEAPSVINMLALPQLQKLLHSGRN